MKFIWTWWVAWSWLWDVVWPWSATDNAISRFDTSSWKIIQDSWITIDDTDNVTWIVNLWSTWTRLTKGWFTDLEVTNIPTVWWASINTWWTLSNVAYLDQANTFSAGNTLNWWIVINEVGADVDFRVEWVWKPNALFIQGSDGKIGIGIDSPSYLLDIVESAANCLQQIGTYSTTASQASGLRFAKSASATIGTLVETVDGEALGNFTALWVNSSSALAGAAQISFLQEGASGASNIGGKIVFRTATNAASVAERMRIDSAGNVSIWAITPTAYLHIKAGTATAGTAPLKFTSWILNTTSESGAIEFSNSSSPAFFMTHSSKRYKIVGSADTVTSSTTVANTTTETTVYSSTIAANEFGVGDVFLARILGLYSSATAAGVDTAIIRIKIGGTTVVSITTTVKLVTDTPLDIEFIGTIRTVWASGSIFAFIKGELDSIAQSVANTAATIINTTTNNTITITVEWGAAKAWNSLTIQQWYLRQL